MTTILNEAFMRLSRRAEGVDRDKLIETFVDVGTLSTLLSSRDHQIVYGRRGTGKTHALLYLAGDCEKNGDITIYLDCRNIGSAGGLYADGTLPVSERATRLLMDTLAKMHEVLLDIFLNEEDKFNLATAGPLLDKFATEITTVEVIGTTEKEILNSATCGESSNAYLKMGASLTGISGGMGSDASTNSSTGIQFRAAQTGTQTHTVRFGALRSVLDEILRLVAPQRIWLLIDEWSAIPLELQPYLADLLRRSVFPLNGISVKIAAIEQRTKFKLQKDSGDYIGIEIGADASADINLDDFMVFDNNDSRAREFFKELLHKHIVSLGITSLPSSSDELVQQGFTQLNAFDEFVTAAEGVPRDAINILSLSAQHALDEKISINHVRKAALNWYQRDKEAATRASKRANSLLHYVIDEVIAKRKCRAFLLSTNTRHPLIDELFDSRLLHLLKRNVSGKERPGERYDVYKLDFGCYVDLITTKEAPQGLFSTEQDEFINNLSLIDDYRSIRRAILDLDKYEATIIS